MKVAIRKGDPSKTVTETADASPNLGLHNGCYNGHDFRVANENAVIGVVKIFCARCAEVRQI